MATNEFRRFPLAVAAVATALLATSCADETGPGRVVYGSFGVAPVFAPAAGIVPVTAGRVVLRRSADGTMVIDTVITLAADADSFDLTLTVPLAVPGETFELTLALVGTAGDTVFRAGPVTVTPVAGTSAPPLIQVPVFYTGIGADAADLLIVPPAAPLFFNDQQTLTAVVLDSAGQPMSGVPVEWRSLDTTRVRVARPDSGRVIAQPLRGPALIVARLLTGQADTVQLLSQPTPSNIVVSSGNNQSAPPGTALELPLVARVVAADAGGVAGVWVRFEVVAGGGILGSGTAIDSALSDAQGLAQAALTVGQAGPQVVEATTSLLPNASAIFNAALAVGAQVFWTNPAGGAWSTGANWSTGVPPGPLDTAVIALAGTYTVTLDVSPTIRGLVLGGATGTQSLDAAAAPQNLVLTGPGTIGPSGRMDLVNGDVILWGGNTLTVNGGTLRVGAGRTLVVGFGDATRIRYAGGRIGGQGALFLNQGAQLDLQAPLSLDSLGLELNDARINDLGGGRLVIQPQSLLLLISQNGSTLEPVVEVQGVLSSVGADDFLSDSLIVLPGGTLQVNASGVSTELTVGALDNAGTVLVGGELPATITVAGGSFVNSPSGTVTVLPGAGTHVINATLANQGTLQLAGSLMVSGGATAAHQNGGAISIFAGQTLAVTGGTFANLAGNPQVGIPPGSIAGEGILEVTGTTFGNSGTVAPGFSPGNLTVAGSFGTGRTGVVQIELGGTEPGLSHDRLQVTGAAEVGTSLTFVPFLDFIPSAADSFQVLTFGSAANHTVPPLDLGGGLFLDTLWSPADLSLIGRRVIPTPGNPVDLAVSSATGRVYALLGLPTGGLASVVALDGTTHEPVDTIVVDAVNPTGLGINPATEKLYVADFQGGVFVIDGRSGALLTGFGLQQAGPATADEANNLVYLTAWVQSVTCTPTCVAITVPALLKVDGATDTLFTADTVHVGGVNRQAFGAAFNPNDGLVYVAVNQTPGVVRVVDPRANQVVASITVPDNPWAVALNTTTNRLYVTSDAANSVTAVDLATRSVIGTVPIGGYVPNVAVDETVNRIYAPNFDASTVTIIDGATNAVLKVIPAGAATDGAYDAVPGAIGAALFIGRYNAGEITVTRR
jgi:YVTN family beta-propeller protein